jgi:hypothetical protein
VELHWYEASGIGKKEFQDRAVPGLNMPSRRAKTQNFAVCIRNAGFEASLEVRKPYPVVDDPDADRNDLIRAIDESGEDYVYPACLFQKLTLPAEIGRALRLAS